MPVGRIEHRRHSYLVKERSDSYMVDAPDGTRVVRSRPNVGPTSLMGSMTLLRFSGEAFPAHMILDCGGNLDHPMRLAA